MRPEISPIERTLKSPLKILDKFCHLWYCIVTMTKHQSILANIAIAQLTQADVHLRAAMVAASEAGVVLATNDIRDACFCLDDAISQVERGIGTKSKKNSKKNLTFAADGL